MTQVHEKIFHITPEFLDALNHVNYLNYVKLIGEVMFEELRTMRGIDLATLRDQHDLGLVLTELNAKYFQFLKLGDVVEATLHAIVKGPKHVEIMAIINKNKKLVATVAITVMSVQYSSGRSVLLPDWIVSRMLDQVVLAE